ncbi:MAG: SufS family cysteine desulfurase [Propionibacteriaceae bacterium]|jgi:cysteine desulfurase/selenocysteine lyase|nr:SufS family cysteine desulfurase [Propionibacteriaceae bacterium]
MARSSARNAHFSRSSSRRPTPARDVPRSPDPVSETIRVETAVHDTLDVARVRADFPILARMMGDNPLTYLDSANTSQKPRDVVAAMAAHDLGHTANVARAMHTLGAEATAAFETARATIAAFIGARDDEIVFAKNASEALNLAAHSLTAGLPGSGEGGHGLGPGDEIVVSIAEHHSNLVPWQMACQRTGATLRWFDVTDEGRFDLDRAREQNLVNERTKIVAVTAMSNVTGAPTPLAEIAEWAHGHGAVVVADGSQLVPHQPVDVVDLGADLLAFTGHKMCGPTGIGVLWGRRDLLATMPPFLGGGEMIAVVTMEESTYANPPHRFEAGTPPITEAIGLAAACAYLDGWGMAAIRDHEGAITAYALERLATVPHLRLLGPTSPQGRGGAISFTLADLHPHDIMQVLDSRGVAVRGGHHCARPLHERFGVQSSVRMSSYLYTTTEEIDRLVDGLRATLAFFKVGQ